MTIYRSDGDTAIDVGRSIQWIKHNAVPSPLGFLYKNCFFVLFWYKEILQQRNHMKIITKTYKKLKPVSGNQMINFYFKWAKPQWDVTKPLYLFI